MSEPTTTPLTGSELVVSGCVLPSAVGLVAGGLGIFAPAMGWWVMVLVVWFAASLPCFVFVVRGLYRSFSPSATSGVLAAVLGIPLACLCVRVGAGVFFAVSSPLRFA
jgi:hypothetical protein